VRLAGKDAISMVERRRQSSEHNVLNGLGGMLAAGLIKQWMRTLDYRVAYYDRTVDPAGAAGCSRIYVFWHEYILFPLYLRGHCRLSMLLSQHRDADILARIAHHVGFDCVRGSTNRGGMQALRALLQKSARMHLAITPDGPRGPRRQMALGPLFLASRLGLPLVPMGFGYNGPWRAGSWDRFAVPRPYSRARGVIGPPIHLKAGLDRTELEFCRQRLERLLTSLTLEAEAWAAAGTRKVGEVVTHPLAAPLEQRANSHAASAADRLFPAGGKPYRAA
jgi:lysophospholipid acyltransferase (LPLAT)-like uncharacterized protein